MSDDSEPLGPRARSLVETGRTLDHPADTDRRRVRAQLTAALGVSALTGAGTQAASASLGAEGGASAATATVEGAAAGASAASATGGVGAAASIGTAAGTAAVSGGFWTTLGAKTAAIFAAAAVSAAIGTVVLRTEETAPASDTQTSSAPTPQQVADARARGAVTTPVVTHSGANAQPSTTALPERDNGQAAAAAATNAQLAAAPAVPSNMDVEGARNRAAALPATARARAVPRDVRGASESVVLAAPRKQIATARPERGAPAAAAPLAAASAAARPERGAPAVVAPLAAAAVPELPDNSSAALPDSAAVPVSASSKSDSLRPAPPVNKPPPLAGELSLLADAQLALREQRLESALELLDEHAFRYPRGALRPERLAARAVVMCRMGRRAEGRAEAKQLETETPTSPLLAWARAACGL